MNKNYFPFFSYKEDTLENLWDDGLIVLDTNVLLNTYKMDNEARNQFFDVLRHKKINSKVIMPFQVGWEFLRNRNITIDESLKSIKDAKSMISKQFQTLDSIIKNSGLKYHQEFMMKIRDNLEQYRKNFESDIQTYNDENRSKRADFYDGNHLKDNDPIINEIKEIFNEKYLDGLNNEDLISKYKEGEYRFSLHIPPGFEDSVKGDYRTYGDFIIWEEMIRASLEHKVPIIFVTEDHKNDWWLHDKKTQQKTPLPELLREFKIRTNQDFYMYSYKQFIEEAKRRYTDLPETDKATTQMDLATQEKETKLSNEATELFLQEQMNHGNSVIANKAYQNYLRLHTNVDVYSLKEHVRKLILKVGEINHEEGLKAFRAYNDMKNESHTGMQIYKLNTLINNLQTYLDEYYGLES